MKSCPYFGDYGEVYVRVENSKDVRIGKNKGVTEVIIEALSGVYTKVLYKRVEKSKR